LPDPGRLGGSRFAGDSVTEFDTCVILLSAEVMKTKASVVAARNFRLEQRIPGQGTQAMFNFLTSSDPNAATAAVFACWPSLWRAAAAPPVADRCP
jgi:hypothetical protein